MQPEQANLILVDTNLVKATNLCAIDLQRIRSHSRNTQLNTLSIMQYQKLLVRLQHPNYRIKVHDLQLLRLRPLPQQPSHGIYERPSIICFTLRQIMIGILATSIPLYIDTSFNHHHSFIYHLSLSANDDGTYCKYTSNLSILPP